MGPLLTPRLHFTGSFCSACLLAACGEQEPKDIDKPTPPDMSALMAIYEAPTGTFDQDSALVAADAAHDIAQQIAELGIDQALQGTVLEAVDAKLNGETTTQGSIGTHRDYQTDGEGYLLVTRICNGWGAEPMPDPMNGDLRLTVGFTEQGVDAVVWGKATSCQYAQGSHRILLHGLDGAAAGELRLSFGSPVAFDQVAARPMLLDLDIAAELDGTETLADFDFRIDPLTGTLELRVAVADGDIIVSASTSLLTGVRAKNGNFGCNESTRTCMAGPQTVTF